MSSFDVKCPNCGERATAKMRPDGVQGTYRAPFVRLAAATVTCPNCGLARSSDTPIPYELWYKASFRGHVIWANNRRHAEFLVGYLLGEEKAEGFDRHVVEVLPGWMIRPKNRRAIAEALKVMLEAT